MTKKAKKASVPVDACVRCGDAGPDLRTLKMACFYSMEEMKLPFESAIYFDADVKDITLVKDGQSIELEGKRVALTAGTVRCSGDMHPQKFYTLRVCKDCRADWMSYIKAWFTDRKANGCGSGIFVRRLGATVEITEEEWYRLNPGREPVRAKL